MITKYYDSLVKTPDLFDAFRFLDDVYYGSPSRLSAGSFEYRVDTNESGMSLSIDLPGLKHKDLVVSVTDRDVKISGKIRTKDFKYTYRISKEYDPSTASATLEDGVLTLKFEKTSTASTKTIEVKVT